MREENNEVEKWFRSVLRGHREDFGVSQGRGCKAVTGHFNSSCRIAKKPWKTSVEARSSVLVRIVQQRIMNLQ